MVVLYLSIDRKKRFIRCDCQLCEHSNGLEDHSMFADIMAELALQDVPVLHAHIYSLVTATNPTHQVSLATSVAINGRCDECGFATVTAVTDALFAGTELLT